MKRSQRQHQAGFSLLEIMIVILIIAVGASLIRFAVVQNDPLEDVEKTGHTFAFWFGTQLDEALLTNTEVGLYFSETSVTLLTWREGDETTGENEFVWEPTNEISFAEGFEELKAELILDVEAEQWVTLESALPEEPQDLIAHVIVFPSEEYEPSFKLALHHEDITETQISILGDGFNRPEVFREER